MKNPGLNAFSVETLIRPLSHPRDIDPLEDDPFYDEGENKSDYVPPVEFGRWRNPGQSIRVPMHKGPAFGPSESPEDVIHGEVITKEDQDSADKILNGDHESEHPSENPYVEHARRELRTPGSAVAVQTLSGLLSGAHPASMSTEDMEAAHQYLSRHFSGVRVNPHHGMLLAQSPAGTQIARRKQNLLAVQEHKPAVIPTTYALTNKHGTFESPDPQRLVRAMVAFQIVHNEIAQQNNKSKNDDDQGEGLTSTSSAEDWGKDWEESWDKDWSKDWDDDKDSSPAAPSPLGDPIPVRKRRRGFHPSLPSFRSPKTLMPSDSVFEPGRGIDKNPKGQFGGYVMPAKNAPSDWWVSQGTAYSPGHHMRLMLDPEEAVKPRNDPRFPGHTFTYAPDPGTGHTTARTLGNVNYWVKDKTHPAARGAGFDNSSDSPRSSSGGGRGRPPRTSPDYIPPFDDEEEEGVGGGRHRSEAATKSNFNDLCPVCASGYLEPYDSEYHECLNCGSLVKHIGFDKEARYKPSRGPLGRGLGDIPLSDSDPLGLASADSDNVERTDQEVPEENYLRPLVSGSPDPDYVGYEAPKKTYLLDKQGSGDKTEFDPLDEQLGKMEFFPLHKPGQVSSRAYARPMPGIKGAYFRLTEGAPDPHGRSTGWALTADHIPTREQWTKGGEPYRNQSIMIDRNTTNPGESKFRQRLRDVGDRVLPEKSFLATGFHPIDDDALNRAIRDVHQHGRDSHTYQKAVLDTAYEPPRTPQLGQGRSQRELRGLSSVGSNPGLSRFSDQTEERR